MSQLRLFDASSIFTLVRELRGEAPDVLEEGSTMSLAYYEVGNAVWRWCFLLNQIARSEAVKLLKSIFEMLRVMDVVELDDEQWGSVILDMAGRLNITYYDAAYLAEAKRSGRVLVTDDEKLAKAAEIENIETVTTQALFRQMRPS